MSDIQFLAVKEFGSKLFHNEGNVTTTGDLATLTASSGKDLYLARAKLNWRNETAARTLVVELKANGTVIETFITETTGAGTYGDGSYEFNMSGIKVAATQIIKLEVITNDSNNFIIEGSIVAFEETTGTTPAI